MTDPAPPPLPEDGINLPVDDDPITERNRRMAYIEVQPAGDDPDGTAHWRVAQQSTGTVFFDDTNKDIAIGYAIRTAQQYRTELVVKDSDGSIAWRNSYGNDPAESPG